MHWDEPFPQLHPPGGFGAGPGDDDFYPGGDAPPGGADWLFGPGLGGAGPGDGGGPDGGGGGHGGGGGGGGGHGGGGRGGHLTHAGRAHFCERELRELQRDLPDVPPPPQPCLQPAARRARMPPGFDAPPDTEEARAAVGDMGIGSTGMNTWRSGPMWSVEVITALMLNLLSALKAAWSKIRSHARAAAAAVPTCTLAAPRHAYKLDHGCPWKHSDGIRGEHA